VNRLSHNPLAQELKAAGRRIERNTKEQQELQADLDWHSHFDRVQAENAARDQQAAVDALKSERAALSARIAEEKAKIGPLKKKSAFGWDPTYWFSSKRDRAKKALSAHRRSLKDLEAQQKALGSQLGKARKRLSAHMGDLERFDGFDPVAAKDTIDKLAAEFPLLHLEYDELALRKSELDRRLKEPIKVLKGLQRELEELEKTHSRLGQLVSSLESDIREAQDYDDALTRAANSYEKAMIHQECERQFGVGRPGAVIADRRKRASQAKADRLRVEGRLDALRRDVAKAHDRVRTVASRGTKLVRALVIDGSNLCYQKRDFIGLAALRPLTAALAKSYDVTVIFDASIRHKLGKVSDAQLSLDLPDARVHVVPSRTQADETILVTAADDFVYVISNDRFSEFRDKSPVRDGRVIRHEIVNGRVIIHDLDLTVPFASRS
jgi:hypothetical protein